MNRPLILPVIHHISPAVSVSEVGVALDAGADGVFLISHHNNDDELVDVAAYAKRLYGDFRIGLNLLSRSASEAASKVVLRGLDMVWADSMGVSSTEVTQEGSHLSELAQSRKDIMFFAGVAFKYQAHEEDPVAAATRARNAGFIPTTSGAGTGKAPDIDKIARMGAVAPLAVASGITPENVALFKPHLAYILVATGISRTEYTIDPAKLRQLVAAVRA